MKVTELWLGEWVVAKNEARGKVVIRKPDGPERSVGHLNCTVLDKVGKCGKPSRRKLAFLQQSVETLTYHITKGCYPI